MIVTAVISHGDSGMRRHVFVVRDFIGGNVPVVSPAGINHSLRFEPAVIRQATHLDGYESRPVAVTAVDTTSAFWTEITGHFIPAVSLDGVSRCLSLDADIFVGKVCIGRVTGAGRFLTIEAMALQHHLRLVANR